MFQYNTIEEFCKAMTDESFHFITFFGICTLFILVMSVIAAVDELTHKHPDFTVPINSFIFNIVIFLCFFVLSNLILDCHYKNNITIKDFTSDFKYTTLIANNSNFKYATLITDNLKYEGYLRTSEYVDEEWSDGVTNVIVYSDKNGYIIAKLIDNNLYINKNAILMSKIDDLKTTIKDSDKTVNNGIIKVAE